MGPELIILAVGGVQWLASFSLLLRLRVPDPGAGARGMAREVSIIIPARNEATNLPRLLPSIAAQALPPCEVIVVDDDSTDGTGEIATAAGAAVVNPGPLPDSWRGKTWACHSGAAAASGRLLLFLDADCWLEERGLEKLLARYQGGALAACPYHAIEKLHEEASAMFNLIMVMGVVPQGLFGQCLLIDRESYNRAGGHESVKAEILENVKLAGRVRAVGSSTAAMTGRGMIAFRMYPGGLGELVNGWTKGFAAGAAATPAFTLVMISAWIGGLITGVVAPFVTPLGWIVYGAFALQMIAMQRKVGAFSPLCGLLYPPVLIFYLGVFARSLGPAGRKATWKGRKLHGA
ncbi:glycosyltransferase family 2 protein [Luteolibacter soli]|uniref:Glycosyltransferase n=1 Tax=Luteolibacter soli TaxID=3135280 RepID=A0ABU9B3X8_9BACT